MLEDWVWYLVFPCVVYASLALSALWLHEDHNDAFFGIAACALALLFIGIHNSWDSVIHITFTLKASAK